MIICTLGKHSYSIPARWEEMNPAEPGKFIAICRAFDLFERGEMDFPTLRVAVASALLGLDGSSMNPDRGVLAENIFRITEQIRFPFEISGQEDGSRIVAIKIYLSQNLLTVIGKKWGGYRFDITADGIVDCSLKAEQYVDALDLMSLYTKTRTIEALDRLVALLYPGVNTGKVKVEEKIAVYYNFRGILEYIRMLPDYQMIFVSTGKKEGGANPLGLSSSIFALSKSGFGTLAEIRELDLFAYLGALVQLTVDGIMSLKSVGMKPVDIAERMHLPVELVLPYVTESKEE